MSMNMLRNIAAVGLVALVIDAAACSNYGNSSPTGPSTPPANAVIIDIIGERGALSYSPDPATVPADRMVSWHNTDSETHRVVFNDGELDTGNIAPGAFTAPMSIVSPGPYHCSIHPSMVGSIKAN